MDAKKLIETIGGLENIDSFSHCMTRLRFNLKDFDLIDEKKAKEVENVIGIQVKGGQVQVVTTGSIEAHFKDVSDYIEKYGKGISKFETDLGEETEKVKTKFGFDTLTNHLSAILSPVIPAIAGGGLLKALYFALTTFNVISRDSSIAFVINMLSDTMFF